MKEKNARYGIERRGSKKSFFSILLNQMRLGTSGLTVSAFSAKDWGCRCCDRCQVKGRFKQSAG